MLVGVLPTSHWVGSTRPCASRFVRRGGVRAGYLGCTSEFRKWEGITYDPVNHKLYTAMSAVEAGMLQGTDTKYDWGLPDHVRTGKES